MPSKEALFRGLSVEAVVLSLSKSVDRSISIGASGRDVGAGDSSQDEIVEAMVRWW
jgi:hypothetical protein